MAKKEKKKFDEFSEETIRQRRKFPILNTILLVLFVVLQIALPIWAACYDPQPQDKIDEYCITVEPREDGTLDIRYDITWTPLDEEEPLTWISVGVANPEIKYYPDLLSDTVKQLSRDVDGDYVAVILDLAQTYYAGETFTLSFTLQQSDMLCKDPRGNFYSFVPGWFNATPVEHYVFRWKDSDGILSTNATRQEEGWYIWEGSMPCGSYVMMDVRYDEQAFEGAEWVTYEDFDDSGVYNELADDKGAVMVLSILGILILLVLEIIIIDSYVSYHRGRGFLRGYGHHMHIYGHSNPRYRSARAAHQSSRGGRSGGGCACACACACAGGGRAGCSQKDTYAAKTPQTKE